MTFVRRNHNVVDTKKGWTGLRDVTFVKIADRSFTTSRTRLIKKEKRNKMTSFAKDKKIDDLK